MCHVLNNESVAFQSEGKQYISMQRKLLDSLSTQLV